ncbi:DUF3465 domain-containing protein [Nitrosomonas sp. JL21]|uniref:DUF3465 domain-containing protein n=1 Tax=Nitrosomonas sp. JL21 TaxID=153949 RepID=UPI00136DEAE8|nr:DUF3465 domain-containing protein [Nitrosomonas sp. JL21]MBL8497252.1 DUF3465 domain-containing protein [Nitrosomonas sp.]MXS77121.1 DUF3465 domain-containing protein [Nitrosomonas sp. JL21]
MKFIFILLLLIPSISFAENFLADSNKLFDFAEKSYPQFFNHAGTKTVALDEYLARYYPDTDIYIGTKDHEVYVYGNAFNGLLKVGLISDFVTVEPDGDTLLAKVFAEARSNVQVYGTGTVVAILSDDLNGSRHQRFVIELKSKQTLLISHNIDLAPRINELFLNDQIEFFGEYEWNDKGGVIHWTHHDPAGIHENGWLFHNNAIYQ